MDEQTNVKKPLWKKWWFWGIVIVIIFALFSGGDESTTPTNKTGDSNPTATAPVESEPVPKNTETKPVVAQKKDWANTDITKNTVKAALAGKGEVKPAFTDRNFPEDITEISIIENVNGTKNVWIYYKPKSSWDETHIVKMAGSTAIFACSILYKNDQVGDVAFFTQGDFTDQYGKSKTDVAVKLVISNDLARKADWKGLANRHESDPGNIFRISDNYHIHLGIKKNIKTSEVSL